MGDYEMLIGELSERTGLSAHTIRYYEKEGLLNGSTRRDPGNNYRHYEDETVIRLILIRRGQAAGFTLGEIKALVRVWTHGGLTIEEKEGIVQQKLDELGAKIAQLQEMQEYLRAKLRLIQSGEELEADSAV